MAVVYIRESTPINMPLNWCYIKDFEGTTSIYVNLPLINNSVATLANLDKMLYCYEIPLSAYNQLLINAPLGSSGEFKTTESVTLPNTFDVYNAISSINGLSGLVSSGDTLLTMANAILEAGYLITFQNKDIFSKNIDMTTPNTVLVSTVDSPYNATYEDVIFVKPDAGDVIIKLPDVVDSVSNKRTQIVFYEGAFNCELTTVSGVDLIGESTTQKLRTNGHALTVQVNKLSESDEYLITQDSRGLRKKEVTLYKASDFIGLSSDVVYVIDGAIDMGAQSIEVPVGGLTFSGEGFNVSSLSSAEENYTMFTGETAGDLFFLGKGVTITVSGANSQVFDLVDSDGSHAVELNSVNFINCTEIGELDGFRQGLMDNNFFSGCTKGFKLSGAWSGFTISRTLLINHGIGNFFSQGTLFTLSGRFVSNANLNMDEATSVGYSFVDGNFQDGGFILSGGRFTGAGTATSILSSSVKANFSNNQGIRSTFIGGKLEIDTPAATTINTTGVYEKLAGTTIASQLEWFDDGGTDNRLRYIGAFEVALYFSGSINLSGSNNNLCSLVVRQYDSSDTLIATSSVFEATLNGGAAGTRIEGLSSQDYFNVNYGDYFEIWITNGTNKNSITAGSGGNLIIKKR